MSGKNIAMYKTRQAMLRRVFCVAMSFALITSFVPTCAFATDGTLDENTPSFSQNTTQDDSASTNDKAVNSDGVETNDTTDTLTSQGEMLDTDSSENSEDSNSESSSDAENSNQLLVECELENTSQQELEAPNEDALFLPMANGAIDLNALWTSQEGGTERPLSITQGGVYTLTANLDVSSWITIDAPNSDVTIDLGEFILSATQLTDNNKYLISASNATSLTVKGKRPFAGVSSDSNALLEQIVVTKGNMHHVIESSCSKLTIQDIGISLKAHKDYTQLTDLNACGVYITKGKASINNCSVTIDHSLQTYSGSGSSYTLTGFPEAVHVGKQAESLEIENSSLEVNASPAAQRRSTVSWSESTYDNAYGIYSEGNADLTIKGGSIAVNCPRGSASCIFGETISIEKFEVPSSALESLPSVQLKDKATSAAILSLKADALEQAYGINAATKGSLLINAPLSFEVGADSLSQYCACLRSFTEQEITFGGSFSGENISVIAGDTLTNANANGFKFAKFANGLSTMQCQSIARSLCNGLDDGACSISFDTEKLFFQLDVTSAPAAIVSADGSQTLCSSVYEALRNQKTGQTVKLLKDVGAVTIDKSVDGGSEAANRIISLDFAGHSIYTLNVNSSSDVRVFSSSGNGIIKGFSTSTKSAVSHSGGGLLAIQNVTIKAVSSTLEGAGVVVSGSGALELDGVQIRFSSQASTSRGIYQSSNSAPIRVRNCNIAAYAENTGLGVRGIESTSSAGNIEVENSTVQVNSLDGVAGAIDVAGSLSVVDCTLTANTRKAASSVFAVRLSKDSARANLSNVSLKATCDESVTDKTYWCLMSGSVQSLYSCAWSLGGNCSFTSSTNTHINHKSTSVDLGASFSCTNDVYVLSENLDNHEAFTLDSAFNTQNAQSIANKFKPVRDSLYDGWTLIKDGNSLVWTHDTVAMIGLKSYPSLADAVLDAKMGDVVTLLTDCTEKQPIVASAAITIDLMGHTANFNLLAKFVFSDTGALTLNGIGANTIKRGNISVSVDVDASMCKRDTCLSAVLAGKSANLTLNGLTISINATGQAFGSNTTQLVGVKAASSSISVLESTSIKTSATSAQPIQAKGLVLEGNSSKLMLDKTSSVTVNNHSSRQETGEIYYPSSSARYNKANLTRFYPDENTAYYEELQTQFKAYAKADAVEDLAGSVFNTRIYYAAPMVMSDGTYVWAFSEPLSQNDLGNLDKIVASAFYSQTRYDMLPVSEGVCILDNGVQADISGSINAVCEQGSTKGINVSSENASSGSIKLKADSSISVSASSQEYRKQADKLDLRDVFDIPNESRKIIYPGGIAPGDYQEIVYAQPECLAISPTGVSSVQIDAGTSVRGSVQSTNNTTHLTQPAKVNPDTVTVTFDNMRSANGTPIAAKSYTLPYASTLSNCANIPVASNYVVDNVTYRFVGWTVTRTGEGTHVWSASNIGEVVVDETMASSSDNITVTAAYVPLLEGQHLITFCVDGYIEAGGVYQNTVPDYTDVVKGSSSSVPTKYHKTSYMIYGFNGWRNASTQAIYKSSLPKVTGDATYVANFTEAPSRIATYYYSWQENSSGKLVYTYDIKRVYCGQNAAEDVAEVAKEGDVLYDTSSVYEFAGWSPRQSDKQALYKYVAPVITESEVSIYGVYNVRERMISASFCVDGQMYAQTDALSGTTSVHDAFSSTGKQKPADKSETIRFYGWSLTDGDTKRLSDSIKTLSELTEEEQPVTLYAVYKDVNIQDTDEEDTNPSGITSPDSPSSTSPKTSAAHLASPSLTSPPKVNAAPSKASKQTLEKTDLTKLPDDGQHMLSNAEEQLPSGESLTESTPSSSINYALIVLIYVIVLFALLIVWWIAHLRHARKLDQEDDFFEPNVTGLRGEKVVF